VYPIIPANEQGHSDGPRRAAAKRGFTLVEVMVATVLLSMIILGILSVLIGSYRVAAKARYNDHARYVIKSMADQFLTQDPFNKSNGSVLTMFQPTVDTGGNSTPLGTGLSWTNTDGSPGVLSPDPLGLYYYVMLGDNSGAPIQATVTRTVWYIYPNSGQPTLVNQNGPGGYMIRGDFTIQFKYPAGPQGVTLAQTITEVRCVP
jgi:prepilin-type N-terminal cleavage/methylation domain-containing protein